MFWKSLLYSLLLLPLVLVSNDLEAHSKEGSNEAALTASRPVLGEFPDKIDFTLRSPRGPVSLAGLKGRAVLIFFGYTSCPDVCPISLATISRVLMRFSADDLDRIQPLFISLDPERDTLEILDQYTNYFHDRILGVTGEMSDLMRVSRLFKVNYQRKNSPHSPRGYSIDHRTDIIVVNTVGRVQGFFPHNDKPATIAAAIQQVLAVER